MSQVVTDGWQDLTFTVTAGERYSPILLQFRFKGKSGVNLRKKVGCDWRISAYRVGGGVAPAVLPHHRTYGSVYGGSWSLMEDQNRCQQ
ncbi:MAG: hypothetical protein Q8P51_10060 [Ignavibacteria bacterium]|nr:hypothetical protein [Ignavibacteria bacterium]